MLMRLLLMPMLRCSVNMILMLASHMFRRRNGRGMVLDTRRCCFWLVIAVAALIIEPRIEVYFRARCSDHRENGLIRVLRRLALSRGDILLSIFALFEPFGILN